MAWFEYLLKSEGTRIRVSWIIATSLQPRGPRRFAPGQDLKAAHQVLGDGPRFARPDPAAVAGDDRDHLGGRARQEALVGRVDVIARERLLADGELRLPAQLDDGIAGDAFEDAGVGGRGEQGPVPDDEEIIAR